MKFKALGVLLMLCSPAFAQFATVTATLADGSGNTSPQAFIHFELYNCGYNFPTVTSPAITAVRTSFDIKPVQPSGQVIGQILGNDAILCGGIASTQWRVTLMKDQNTALQPTQQYFIASNSTWTPASPPATQPPPAPGWIQIYGNPTGNQTITQPAGTSLKIVGVLDLTQATVLGFSGGGGGGPGGGTVTSVAMTVPSWLTVAGSPIVTAGVLAVSPATGQASHQVIGTGSGSSFGPVTLTAADLPFTYTGNTTLLATAIGTFHQGNTVTTDANGNLIDSGTTGGSGTVTNFGAGALAPLFTTSVTNSTSTPSLTFTLTNAGGHLWFGNNTGSSAAPGYEAIGVADLPFTYSGSTTKLATASGTYVNGHCASFDASGNIVDSGLVGCAGQTSGTVTSVALTVPAWEAVTGSPIVNSGTLAVSAATGLTTHQVVGTGTTGTTQLLSLTTADLPFTYSGNTLKLGTVSGSFTAGHALVWDASGNIVDSGGTAGAGTVTSVGASFTGGLIAVGGTPVVNSGTLAFTVAGTSGGIPYFSSASTWASSGVLTANLPVIGGGAGVSPSVGTVTGNTTKFATSTGALTNGHCASWDASGNVVDFGSACGGGGGGGTVTNVGLAAPTGFTVSGSPVIASGTLTFTMPSGWATGSLLIGNGANSVASLAIGTTGKFLQSNGTTAIWANGGTVTSVAETFTGGLISVSGSPITSTGTLALTVAGTSGGIPYFSSASTWASSGVLTANRPIIGGGVGVAPSSGAITGNTTTFATSTGTLTNGHCASWDANGNIVDSGTLGCGNGSVVSVGFSGPTGFIVTGSPVVNAGTLTMAMPTGWSQGSLLVGNGANSVTNLALGSSGKVLTSNGTTAIWSPFSGVTSVGLSLPSQFTVTNSPVTAAGVLTVSWANVAAHKWLGNNTGASAIPAFASIGVADLPFTYSGNTTILATTTGTLKNGDCVSIDANGNLVDSGVAGCGSGSGGGGTASGTSTEIQFRNSTTGGFASDATMFFTTASHTATFDNVVITGTLSVNGYANLQSQIPASPLALPPAGTSAFQILTNGDFGVSNSGGAVNDLFEHYEAGVLTRNHKSYTNTQVLASGTATHTFANSFAYTASNTFGCTCTDQSAANACRAVPASATTVTVSGTGTDTIWLSCEGH